jgi:hypothetical protein
MNFWFPCWLLEVLLAHRVTENASLRRRDKCECEATRSFGTGDLVGGQSYQITTLKLNTIPFLAHCSKKHAWSSIVWVFSELWIIMRYNDIVSQLLWISGGFSITKHSSRDQETSRWRHPSQPGHPAPTQATMWSKTRSRCGRKMEERNERNERNEHL